MRKSLVFFVAIAAIVLVLTGSDAARSQDSEDIPPQVIDIWPLPGVELSPDDPLTLTFNQPMDQASVEAAFQSDPAFESSFTWTDARTVNILPAAGWQRATDYTVTIAASAVAQNGLSLPDPVQIEVKTVGPLEVASVVPEDGAEGVAADARIVVTFNRPVVPLVSTEQLDELPDPITIEPALEGTGEWLNTGIYVFNPAEALSGGAEYTITVTAGLTSVDGAVLDTDYAWSFETLPPQILGITPTADQEGVLLDANVEIRFSQPMDQPSAEEAFYLLSGGDRVAGSFTWDQNSTVMSFIPDENLTIDQTYLINIADSARSAAGEATLGRGYSQSFRTVPYPGVRSTWPLNGDRDVHPGSGASIEFKSPMNTDTLQGLIEISPEPEEWMPVVWGNQSLNLDFRSLPETTYTITLKAGAEDIYGNAIETDYTFSYTTRAIDTWASPILSWGARLMLTGAHRQDTRFSILVSGSPTVSYQVFAIPDDDMVSIAEEMIRERSYYYDEELPPWARDENLLRTWEETYDSAGIEGVPKEVLLASEEGGTLPNGTYWVIIKAPDRGDGIQTFQFGLSVTSANLTVKRGPNEALVWVTDMPSAEPVQETTVTIYHKGQAIARGQTDAEGVFKAPTSLPESDDFIFIVAEGAGVYGVWFSNSDRDLPTENNYIYTDRPIYRPGETVYFRGVLRDRNDMDYQIPNIRTVPVTITAADGTQLYQAELPVTEFGTFSGELEIPEDAAIGEAYIQLPNSSVYFTIAEFRVPEFEVNVTAQQDEIRQGESLNAVVEADYYFGGGVSNAEVYWSAYGNPASFNYTGPGHYNFSDATLSRFYSHYIGDGTATTDGDGNFVINIENTAAPAPIPMNITVEATVTDESMQAISGRTTVMAHPANAYVGIRSDRYFGREGQPLNLEMIAVDRDSQPLADKRIELTMVEIRWTREPIDGQFGRYNWTQEEIDVETVELRTSENGTVTYEFTPPNAGIFRARAVVLDEFERPNSSTLRFWVTGSRPVWWGQPSDRIDLIADKDSYQVGDTAEILVPIPFAGGSTVMVTTERAGVISYEVIEVEGSTLLYELPIVETHVPTVYVSVALVKGIDEESLNPEYRTGTIALSVEPVAERLNVKITPSAELTQPGDVLTFDIEVTNAAGEPVQTEIGLALTDKAILALAPPNTGSLENNFYGHQVNYVITRVSIEALLDRITDETVGTENERDEARGVGGGEAAEEGDFAADAEVAAAPTAAPGAEGRQAGPDAVPVREDFQQTPLWEGHVVTDQDGFATVSVELPDNLTTWKLDARGVTLQTQVGQSTTEVVTTLPLLVRPVTPRFLVVGDRVQLASVINNNTPDEQTVEATLRYEGVDLESPATQEVTIPAGGRARVEWTAVAQDVEGVDLTFIAVGADGYQDASKPPLATGPDDTIPVYRYTAPDRVGTGGLLREGGARVEGISLPPRLDTSQGELVIRADPSLAVTTIDSMDYLINYPHQCIEQTVSRFLPNVVTYRALRDLDISDPELEANLFSVLDEALDRLEREQNPDGGWGWFSGMDSNALVTAYAALGLIHARDAGFDVDPAMLERALNFVRSDYITPTIDSSRWRLNRQAFYFYVLAHDGRGSEREFDALHDLRLNMTLTGRAYLLMAYHKLYPNSGAIDDLASDLNTAAILSATGAHWEEDWHDWWNWTSDTRTTALALNALTLVQPDNELLPQAVRWLMVARNGDHWETTQETAWSIIALTDWMVSTGELQGNYNYSVNLNRDTLAEKDVTPETVRDGEVLRIAVSELLTDEINRLIFAREDGTGVLYYTAHLNLRLPASEVDALNRGVMIKRQYFLDGDPENPITSAEVGETITVRLTITLPQDIYYFVLEDPIPAGTEPLDTSLLTTSRQVEGPTLRPGNDREWFWYWGWWWFDRTEMRDEQVNLYADFLPRGTYTYTYQVRASVPGEFQTMPTEAYAFYFPEVFGRTEGELFTVTPASEE